MKQFKEKSTCVYFNSSIKNFVVVVFLAAQSSSRRLVVSRSVGPSVGWSVTLVKKLPVEYQMVTKTYLPSYLCNSSDSSDSSDSCYSSDSSESSYNSDSSDSRDSSNQKNLFTKLLFFHQKFFFTTKKT